VQNRRGQDFGNEGNLLDSKHRGSFPNPFERPGTPFQPGSGSGSNGRQRRVSSSAPMLVLPSVQCLGLSQAWEYLSFWAWSTPILFGHVHSSPKHPDPALISAWPSFNSFCDRDAYQIPPGAQIAAGRSLQMKGLGLEACVQRATSCVQDNICSDTY
jgi:hypothetical protein